MDKPKTAAERTVTEAGGDGGSENAMETFVRQTAEKGIAGLIKEFGRIPKLNESLPKTVGKRNHDLNRFNNISCYDHTRVKLQFGVPPYTDYIHANRVFHSEMEESSWICSQAPLEKTISDFWRMAWQEKTDHIVMLCNTEEGGEEKCAKYLPPVGETKRYGFLIIKNIRQEKAESTDFISSFVSITDSQSKKEFLLYHHQLTTWADHAVPKTGQGILKLLKRLRKSNAKNVIVHCSAGVGRTGTVVALEICIRSLEKGKAINPTKILNDLRNQRAGAIQTDSQYIFLHYAVHQYLFLKNISKEKCRLFFNEYEKYMNMKRFLCFPSSASFPTTGGSSTLYLSNQRLIRYAYKIRTSNVEKLRVEPYGFIKACSLAPIQISRLPGPPKTDTFTVLFAPVSDEASNPKAVFTANQQYEQLEIKVTGE